MKPVLFSVLVLLAAAPANASDIFLTIGGGYSPQGNQASLEANVQFLQDVLAEEYASPPKHQIYFADGFDKGKDLQVAAKKQPLTAARLIAGLHSTRSRGGASVFYRNHQVEQITGATKPENIESGLREAASQLKPGDRLFVYVTAHGSSAKGDDPFNTTIDCWNRKKITSQQLSRWLDEVHRDVPVIMVMAQCYCGGFAHSIFEEGDRSKGLANGIRTGFFAQQHNLAAAGCRPDIDNDEEYSSFFWGALVGRSRNGRAIGSVDLNGDGLTSFAEAHAYTVLASNTIDIPLRASEALLREYAVPDNAKGQTGSDADQKKKSQERLLDRLREDTGTISDLVATARTDTRELISALVDRLGLSMDMGVNEAVDAWGKEQDAFRTARRATYRGRSKRAVAGREELKEEIFIVWPELADKENWQKSELLNKKNRDGFLEELKLLPSFATYEKTLKQREQAAAVAESAELTQIKSRRLIETLLSVSLARRLPDVAPPEIVERYEQMVKIEESGLGFQD